LFDHIFYTSTKSSLVSGEKNGGEIEVNTKVKLVVLISAILAVVTISSVLTASIVGKKPGRIDTPAYDSG